MWVALITGIVCLLIGAVSWYTDSSPVIFWKLNLAMGGLNLGFAAFIYFKPIILNYIL